MDPYTVFACESCPIVVEGLSSLFGQHTDLSLVGSAAGVTAALLEVAQLRPQVVLMDPAFGIRQILQFIGDANCASPRSRIVLWAAALDSSDYSRALQQGARGVLQKASPLPKILDCVRTVASGGVWVEQTATAQMAAVQDRKSGPRLTPRETEIVQLVCRGLKNRQISELLGITPGTVKVHLMHIFEKTGAKDRFELALGARRLTTGSEGAAAFSAAGD